MIYNFKLETMKILLISIALSLLACSAPESKKSGFNDFYERHQNDKDVLTFKLPSFLARSIINDEKDEMKGFIKKTTSIRFIVCENNISSTKQELENALSPDMYKDLIIIKDGSVKIRFRLWEEEETIKEVLTTVDGNDSFLAICFQGDFTFDEVRELVKSLDTHAIKNVKETE